MQTARQRAPAGRPGRKRLVALAITGGSVLIGLIAAVVLPVWEARTRAVGVEHAAALLHRQAALALAQRQRSGAYPATLGGLPADAGPVESLAIDPERGVIEMRLKLGPDGPAGSVFLTPDPAAPSGWQCAVSPRLADHEGRACGPLR